MSRAVITGSADQSIRVWAYDSSGVAITGEAYNSAGIAVSVVVRSAGRIVSTTALTLVARSGVGVHTDSAFTEVGAGEYVVDLADSYSATAGRDVSVTLTSDAITGGYVLSETLAVGQAAELDSDTQTQIDNIENAAGYLLALNAGAITNPQTATETYVISVFGSQFQVALSGLDATGTRTAPTLTKT
jgi:hypothetical protein